MPKRNIEVRKEAWALSEIKDTIVLSHSLFLDAQKNFVDCILPEPQQSPIRARQSYVTSLLSYYCNCQGAFDDHIEKKQDVIIKHFELDTTKFKNLKKTYKLIGINHNDLENEELYKLGAILTDWNTKEGYLRLIENKTVYDDPVDAIIESYNEE